MKTIEDIKAASNHIKALCDGGIDIAIVLGSGLGKLADKIEKPVKIKYKDIPGFPESTVKGHAGEMIIGELKGKKIIAMNGRFHFYEGYPLNTITFPIRVIKELGVNSLIITNAAGGMNPEFEAGDLMIITDHINMIGDNPLIGANYDALGPRFPDMSEAYKKEYIDLANRTAEKLNIMVKNGVYVPVSGPTYETSAELRYLRFLGGDAVGMSTVPEVIAANHMSMKVLGISVITDMAIADNLEPLDHIRVMETANKATEKFVRLVEGIIEEM
ncbi:purine-nucleoside phosphorylase [Clostridium polynesiense]|uniref:purine-nucleoside phosphorylase n=1 Tax=Clostridium polynesiense TaxID=1325933 RepID=UPI00058D14CD|nr:purine-nucleoside phosphorylase [Clostridium polynesiense]